MKGNSSSPLHLRGQEDVDQDWDGMGQIATQSGARVDLPPAVRVVDEGTLAVWALLEGAARRDDEARHGTVRFIEP